MALTELDKAALWYYQCGTGIITSIQALQKIENLFSERRISQRESNLHVQEITCEIARVQKLLAEVQEKLLKG